MTRLSRLILGAVIVGLGAPSEHAQADIYRYVDGNGVVHFTNVRSRAKGKAWQRVVHQRGTRRGKRVASDPSARPVSVYDPSPQRFIRYDAFIREASLIYNLPESFIRAVMVVESNFHAEVVSYVGAMGLMQLMPGTASRMGVSNPFEPRQNILGGSRYLRTLANQFNGDMVLTLAAYNAGENAVVRYGGVPPYDETRRYIKRVLHHYYNLRAKQAGRPLVAQR